MAPAAGMYNAALDGVLWTEVGDYSRYPTLPQAAAYAKMGASKCKSLWTAWQRVYVRIFRAAVRSERIVFVGARYKHVRCTNSKLRALYTRLPPAK